MEINAAELVQTLLSEVRRIGDHLLTEQSKLGELIYKKQDDSPFAMADNWANAELHAALKKHDPHWLPIVSEETIAAPYAERKQWQNYWLIDPLDGTKEYRAGKIDFTINVALMSSNEPVGGIVYAPAHKKLFYAARGLGTFLIAGTSTPKKLETSQTSPPSRRAVISASQGAPPRLDLAEKYRIGSAVKVGSSLKFCILAEGGADMYLRLVPIMEWDVAAGDCVYRYASSGKPNHSPFVYNTETMKYLSFVYGLSADECFLER